MNYRIIHPEDIVRHELYYNERVQTQINELCDLLAPTNFEKVQRRMKRVHMNHGVVILLSGPSGTGKTEAVLQIARRTNRAIVKSEFTRSRYVGESERLMRQFFNEYECLCIKSRREKRNIPILFFDECDGILSQRCSVNRSGGVHENALQDILLGLVGNTAGIICLTTNYEKNIDTAFMRRILYHVRVTKPDQSVRASIIRSLFNTLSVEDVKTLSEYRMTGGNWSNVFQKCNIRYVIYKEKPNMQNIMDVCKQEMGMLDIQQRIGFC